MITTTLYEIKQRNPCSVGYYDLTQGLGLSHGFHDPFKLSSVYDHNGRADFTWVLCKLYPRLVVAFNLYVAFHTLWMRDLAPSPALEAALNAFKVGGNPAPLRGIPTADLRSIPTVYYTVEAVDRLLRGVKTPAKAHALWVYVDDGVVIACSAVEGHAVEHTMCRHLCELLDTMDGPEAVINSLLDAIPSPAQA